MPWSTFTKYPYEPLYSADITVPSATTFICVPLLAAISNPVCLDDLILLLTPYLDDIVPETGIVAILIPFIFVISVFSSVFKSNFFIKFCSATSIVFVFNSCTLLVVFSLTSNFISSDDNFFISSTSFSAVSLSSTFSTFSLSYAIS